MNSLFDFAGLWNEAKTIIRHPKEYLTALKTEGGLPEPMRLVAGYIVLATLFISLSTIFTLPTLSVAIITIIVSPIVALFWFLITIAIVWALSALCGGKKELEASFRVAAALYVVFPLQALVQMIPYLGAIANFILMFYLIWLLYIALVQTLGAQRKRALIAAIILISLVLVLIIGFIAAMVVYMTSPEGAAYMQQMHQGGLPPVAK